jgi:hypothetical protein
LQDIFGSITDRIAKLETGPNEAMYTAESAQTTASDAQVQAINAGVQANNAASQATIAQSQATIASTQATAAQTSADGKNKIYYSTSTPGSTANSVGDIWYQYGSSGTYANKVIAQWSGAGGTSWTSVTISGLIVANLDAGSITTGTLSAIQIDAGSGSQKFNVSSTGYLSAQGAYIKGNITADSGTFTGSIRANDGYFGTGTGSTLTNGWSIGATGLTGVGTGNITGGTITGSTVQTSSGNTSVSMISSSNSLTFKNSGSNVGHILPLSSNGILMHYGATADASGGTRPQMYVGSSNVSMQADTTNIIGVAAGGPATISGNSVSITGATNLNSTTTYTGITTGSGSTMVVVTTGSRIAYTTSSERFKQNIEYITSDGWLDKIAKLEPITYKTSDDFTTEGEPNETQVGFLAEDIADLENELSMVVIKDPLGDPFSISYERITPFLVLAIKELKQRITSLETKLFNP